MKVATEKEDFIITLKRDEVFMLEEGLRNTSCRLCSLKLKCPEDNNFCLLLREQLIWCRSQKEKETLDDRRTI